MVRFARAFAHLVYSRIASLIFYTSSSVMTIERTRYFLKNVQRCNNNNYFKKLKLSARCRLTCSSDDWRMASGNWVRLNWAHYILPLASYLLSPSLYSPSFSFSFLASTPWWLRRIPVSLLLFLHYCFYTHYIRFFFILILFYSFCYHPHSLYLLFYVHFRPLTLFLFIFS